MTRSIIMTTRTELASKAARRQISSKTISRSIDDFRHLLLTMAAEEETAALTFTNFFEVMSSHPVTLKITPNGGAQFSLPVQNYFCMTAQTADSFSVIVDNESTTQVVEIQLNFS